MFNIRGKETLYSLSSCAGRIKTHGRRADGFTIESLDHSIKMNLPSLLECNQIPDSKEEIPTPEVTHHYPHLRAIAEFIPPLDTEAKIQLLIGRDLLEAHHVLDQLIGPRNLPYAQKLGLGWVIIGEACLNKVHIPQIVNVNKTCLLQNGRSSTFDPCPYNFEISQDVYEDIYHHHKNQKCFGVGVFKTTEDDEKEGMSIEDLNFIHIMQKGFHKNANGNWVAPLPFKDTRPKLPNNYSLALQRAKGLDRVLTRDSTRREHFITFMEKLLENGHAEIAPPLKPHEEYWFLPIFGVYHPKKKDQIRGVFDSSAEVNGISLNSVLLTGPTLINSLLGVLLRFRKELVAIMADIQQMFYCFMVEEDHRNYLRFLWHEDNDLNNELVQYRMCVHAFGNNPLQPMDQD